MSPPEKAPAALTPEQRRANVRRVREAAAELKDVENALADAEARIGPLRTKVKRIRETIEGVMTPPGEEEPGG